MTVRSLLLVAATGAILGFWGCREDTDDVAGEPGSPTTAEEVRQKSDEALGAAAEYLGQKKDEFVAYAEKQVGELERNFEDLSRTSSEAADQTDRRLEDLRAEVGKRLSRARDELGDLRDAGEQTWQKAAAEFGSALTEVREAYEDFVRAYKSERQPQADPNAAPG